MTAIDKVTKRAHSFCNVLGGYQVCLIPDMTWDDAQASDIHVFTETEFNARFELTK